LQAGVFHTIKRIQTKTLAHTTPNEIMIRFIPLITAFILVFLHTGTAFAAIPKDEQAEKQALKEELDGIKEEVKALIEEIKEEIRLEQIKLKKEMAELKREMAQEQGGSSNILNTVRNEAIKEREKTKKDLEDYKSSAKKIQEDAAAALQEQKDISAKSTDEMNKAIVESRSEYNKINEENAKILEQSKTDNAIDKNEQQRLLQEVRKEIASGLQKARIEQEKAKKEILNITHDAKKSALAGTSDVLADSKEIFRGIAQDAKKTSLADTSSVLDEMRKHKTQSHNIGEKVKRNLIDNQIANRGQLIKEKLEQESVIKNARKTGNRQLRVAKTNTKEIKERQQTKITNRLKRQASPKYNDKLRRDKRRIGKESAQIKLRGQSSTEKKQISKSSGQKKEAERITRGRKFTLAKQAGVEGEKGGQGAEQNLGRKAKSVAGIRGFKQLEAGDIFLAEEALDEEDLAQERELERLRKLEEERHEGQRAVLRKFSTEIKGIQQKLVRRQVSETPALMQLGNLYMDSQRFLDSLNRADRSLLFKKDSDLIPGGAELAIVAYKMALERRPLDGRLSMILGEIYEGMGDFKNAELYGRKAFSLFSRSRQTQLANETQEFLNSIQKQKTQSLTPADNSAGFSLLPASLSESDLP